MGLPVKRRQALLASNLIEE